MNRFTDRLWRDLVREHGQELAQFRSPAADRNRWARPRVLAGSSLGVAAVGTAVALLLGAATSSPAFALSPNHDGTVQIRIFTSAGITGANAKLSAMGIRARVVQVAAGCQKMLRSHWVTLPPNAARAQSDPRRIPVGTTLVIACLRANHHLVVAPATVVRGAVPGCVPPIPPAAPTAAERHPPTPKHTNSTGTTPTGGSQAHFVGPPVQVPIRCRVRIGSPPPGNGGNTGNSGSSGNG